MDLEKTREDVQKEADGLKEMILKGREQLSQAEQRYVALMGQLELIGKLEAPEEES